MTGPDTRLPSQRTGSAYEGPILTALLTLAIPIVAGNMLQSAYQLLDAFWVGRLGAALSTSGSGWASGAALAVFSGCGSGVRAAAATAASTA